MDYSKYLSDVEEVIEEARNGRMFILIDDENRENEGDLVVPAQMATPEAINFMAMHVSRSNLPCFDKGAGGGTGSPFDGEEEPISPGNRFHDLDRGSRGRDDRHFGTRSGANYRGRH